MGFPIGFLARPDNSDRWYYKIGRKLHQKSLDNKLSFISNVRFRRYFSAHARLCLLKNNSGPSWASDPLDKSKFNDG